ncbi:hypothetical protein P8452_04238 [Trifolium repens]|nr:hypothetical protein P8452_04238 [Trifolium repens]
MDLNVVHKTYCEMMKHLNHFLIADSRERITFSCWKKKLWIQVLIFKLTRRLQLSFKYNYQRSVCIRDEAFRSKWLKFVEDAVHTVFHAVAVK